MYKTWFRLCSLLLVVVLLANMLPLQTFAEQLSTGEMGQISTGTDLSEEEASSGQIVDEFIDKRTEYTKQFRMDNGLFIAAVYNDPIHYEKDGQWVEIDNTLKAQLDGTYINTAGVWNVSFPNQLTKDNRISVTKDTYTLSFGMAGELRTSGDLEVMSAEETVAPAAVDVLSPSGLIGGGTAETFAVTQAQTSTAQLETVDIAAVKAEAEHPEMVADKLYSGLQYNNVYGTTDIRYNLNSNTVKESIILESYSGTLRGYRYTLEVGDLNPALQDDGSIHFYDVENKEIVMVMEAPFLVDAALEYNYDVQVRLTGSGSTYTLTYLLPTSWLASSDRAWPVILDPVIKASLQATNIKDQSVAENTTYDYTRGINECGHCAVDGIQRFFMKYVHLPALTSSDVIVKATVKMEKPQTSTTTAVVQVHKVLGTWESDTITWDNKPDYDPTIEDFLVVWEADWYQWEITDIARGWYEGENTGMMFRVDDVVESSTGNNWKQFYSSNYSYYPTHMPTLEIEFRNNNGLESYWDYTASSAGRAGSGYVNNYTGNLVWIRGDIGFSGNRMPVSISHVYNANDAIVITEDDANTNNSNDTAGNAFGLGNGWRTNYNQLVYQWSKDSQYYVWEDSDGTDHYFKYASSGVYKDEDDLELTLNTVSSGESMTFTIKDKDSNTSYFDTFGRLIKLENNQATKSSVNIAYVGDTKRIATITDGAGRKYNFTYNDSELLTRISYVGNGTTEISFVSFSYDDSGNNNLAAVIDKDSKESRYTYGANNLLLTAQDIDGYKLTYTYNTMQTGKPARIHTVTETDVSQDAPEGSDQSVTGGSLTFDYQHNQTTITDRNGNKQILQFNNMGNTMCIQDGLGRAQYATFAKNNASDTGKANQLKVASKLQYTVGNIVSDSSFESSTLWSLEPSDATASRSISSTGYYGSKSMLLTATDAADLLGSTFTVAAGESYTFSAYVKVTAGSAKLALRNTADTGNIKYSETLTSNVWTRLEVCYTNEGTDSVTVVPILSAAAGTTAYMDCVQIEKAPTASRYNLVENGDFRYNFTNWTKTYCETTGTIVQATKHENGVEVPDPAAPQLDNTVFRLHGTSTYEKRISQTVKVSGEEGDTFVFGGWAKGNSTRLGKVRDYTREFAVRMRFKHTDGTNSSYFTARFNPDSNEWQYTAADAVAPEDYWAIELQVLYHNNMNAVYFDGIQLYREEFGTSYTYDEKGNVTSVTDLQKKTTTYEYDTNSNLTKIIQDNKAKMTYVYYPNSKNVKTATSAEGLVYHFEYDAWGNTTSVSIGSGETKITSSAVYSDDGNRLVSTTDALGKVTTYSYNADTNVLEWVKYPEDTDATKTTYTYDEMYRIATAAVTTDTNLSLSAAYTYDNDLLTKLQTASTTYDFSYGDFALRSSVKIGERTLASYTYTDDGNYYLSSLDYGNGDSIEYEYDGLGRVTIQTYEDGDEVTYQYDNSGALATVTDSATGRKTTYYYDFTDRLMKYVETGTDHYHSVGYEYDTDNNLTSLVETINGTDYTTSYVYDDDNRLTSMTTNGTTVEYTYDDYGRVTTQVTKRGETTILTETFTYVNPSETTTSSQIATYTTVATNYTVTYAYTYDDNGNILSVTESMNTAGTEQEYVTTYVYDSANQLIRENNQRRNKSYTWTYDNAGNVLSEKTYAYTTGDLSAATPTVNNSYTYGDEDWGDLLTAYNGTAITYDEVGNPNGYNDRTFTWEHGRQLATQTKGNVEWEYTYNNAGLRTKRSSDSKTYEYVYSGDKLVQMTITDHTTSPETVQLLEFSYDAAGQPLTMTQDGTLYYYVLNVQGDVTGLIDGDGNLLICYLYEGFGEGYYTANTSNQTAVLASTNPLGYRGYVLDIGTAIYYLQSRYYDPALGRFINADNYSATGQDLLGNNMFAYCGNDPVCRSDPSGNIWRRNVTVAAFGIGDGWGSLGTNTVLVLSNSDDNWMASSEIMGEDMADAVGAGDSRVEAVTTDNFSDIWKQANDNYVIIHTHGSPSVLEADELYLKASDISSLEQNSNIKFVLITACSTGGSNGAYANVGQLISQKISPDGYVICSTTDVSGGSKTFTATDGGAWIVYRNGVQITAFFPTTITMADAASYWSWGCK